MASLGTFMFIVFGSDKIIYIAWYELYLEVRMQIRLAWIKYFCPETKFDMKKAEMEMFSSDKINIINESHDVENTTSTMASSIGANGAERINV
jgi:hypothetical protein